MALIYYWVDTLIIFLGFWLFLQFFNAAGSGAGAGIAWWAHIGGFIAGFVLVKLNRTVPKTSVPGWPGEKISSLKAKKRTPKLQMIVAESSHDSPDLYGNIDITSIEAISGASKMVTIPWGFYRPLYKVRIPPGVKSGTRLRLAGMGRVGPDGTKGDMYLKVNIKNAF